MSQEILLQSDNPIIQRLDFKPYRSTVERRVERFVPATDELQNMDIKTPWGEHLTANAGDYLVSELDTPPDDCWPVKASIFEKTYLETRPGFCIKRALTMLVPLVDVAAGDPDVNVTVETLEGLVSVRAGDFYLALGVQGEIWPYPKNKIDKVMAPVEEL